MSDSTSLRVEPMTRAEIDRHLWDIADLRIRVFAAFPYLYDGDRDYEARYLATYRENPDAIVVGAWDGDRLVGASTGTPMEAHSEDFAAAFAGPALPIRDIFYCAESVLLPEFRGRGAGHRFFDLREAHARRLGRRWSAFCAVIRPPDHPDRPPDYRDLEPFWRARGYEPLEGAIAHFAWRDHGDDHETDKPLQFWIRALVEDNPGESP
jgi:GNAT superfamily N-acetyltransferase